MFHACAVKIAKIDAHSSPSRLPGNSAMNAVTVTDRNPRTGTDCRMSSRRDHHLLRAATARGGVPVGQREHRGQRERGEHPQQAARCVVRQVGRIAADRRDMRRREGHRRAPSHPGGSRRGPRAPPPARRRPATPKRRRRSAPLRGRCATWSPVQPSSDCREEDPSLAPCGEAALGAAAVGDAAAIRSYAGPSRRRKDRLVTRRHQAAASARDAAVWSTDREPSRGARPDDGTADCH